AMRCSPLSPKALAISRLPAGLSEVWMNSITCSREGRPRDLRGRGGIEGLWRVSPVPASNARGGMRCRAFAATTSPSSRNKFGMTNLENGALDVRCAPGLPMREIVGDGCTRYKRAFDL